MYLSFGSHREVQVNELTAARDVLRQDVEGQAAKFQRATQAVEAARGRAIHAGVQLAPEEPFAVDIATRQVRVQVEGYEWS